MGPVFSFTSSGEGFYGRGTYQKGNVGGKRGGGGAGDSNYGMHSADIKKDDESTFTLRGLLYMYAHVDLFIHKFNKWLSIRFVLFNSMELNLKRLK